MLPASLTRNAADSGAEIALKTWRAELALPEWVDPRRKLSDLRSIE